MAKAPIPGGDKPSKGWQFEVFGETFHESELTLDQYIRLEKELDVPWGSIHPIRSANHALQIAALMYSERTTTPFADALTKIGQVGAVEFIDGLALLGPEDDAADPPEAGEAGSTIS